MNESDFPNTATFLSALQATNYDVLLIDLFFDGTEESELSASEVAALRAKANGGSRIVLAYMSIGEAEHYRYYRKGSWNDNKPVWLAGENSDLPGNYKVRYWSDDWKEIIYENDQSYLKKIIDAGFDGVYLDIIDAYEYFED
ncbi:endo alpha-1,4 polygalactosaminidase [Sediminispirochaeta smaragdinae]|uniref:endo alpha-1,4 polygalactosaminidase n=1 Tax=Sediminispirochaeta smaragdinae TaxID=55206 RepID=UPI00031E1126|nr:endo alpha-1,4 polygalactosaminidase [Sediminispirochaeta smaragdinae]